MSMRNPYQTPQADLVVDSTPRRGGQRKTARKGARGLTFVLFGIAAFIMLAGYGGHAVYPALFVSWLSSWILYKLSKYRSGKKGSDDR